MNKDRLERLLSELGARNADNITRTESYLELYAITRERGRDLPWILMAHLVSRNGGYAMADVGSARDRGKSPFSTAALENLFLFLERANFLIFYDAWYHLLHHLLGRTPDPARTPRFICACWPRYEARARKGVNSEVERDLVCDLVRNEQNYIEHRVAHHPRFEKAQAMVRFAEAVGADAPLVFPKSDAKIKVGTFAFLERRIATGVRIFDEILADNSRRAEIFRWAIDHPHTGSRAVYGGRPGPTIRAAWPITEVRALSPDIHAPPEPDPEWP